jgi:integrase
MQCIRDESIVSIALAVALREQQTRVLALHVAHADIWDDHDLCFPNPLGLSHTVQPVRDSLRALCESAGVPALTPHGLRHTAASLLAELAPVAVARDMLGHASLTMTNTYVHASDTAKLAGSTALADLLTGS